MSKVIVEIKKQIIDATKKLEGLRAEYDRLDANHAAQQNQIARDIKIMAEHLESLLKLEKLMSEER